MMDKKKSVETLIDVLDNFHCVSGLKLNASTCTALKAGSLKYSNNTYCQGKTNHWYNDSAKTLSIIFHTDTRKVNC